jgi:hypothetical protein
MSHSMTKIFMSLALWLGLSASLHAQRYFFIEADRQQPFYVRMDGQLISSSAGGFLLVPKVESERLLLTIGFPKNQFPEITFELRQMDRDRGFQLKDFGEKGWGLFDRNSLQVVMPAATSDEKMLVVEKSKTDGFASMLAAVTGDSTLVDRKQSVTLPPPSKKQVLAVSVPIRDSLIKKDVVRKPVITGTVLMENEEKKLIVYVEQHSNGYNDTIRVEISQESAVSKILPPVVSKIPVCDRPFADGKDIKALQRKLLGSSDLSEQISAVVKAFKEKCFNCKQAMDLGWMLSDEGMRLKMFEAIKALVMDPDQFSKLESVFMKDESIRAFQQLSGKN